MQINNANNATYVRSHEIKRRYPQQRIASTFACILAILLIFTGILANGITNIEQQKTQSATQVKADGSSDQSTLNDAAGKYGSSGSQDGFDKTSEKLLTDEKGKNDPTSWAYILDRIFGTTYLNKTEHATAAGDNTNPVYNCDKNNKYAGTATYHNCDVPNITTEFLQKVIQTISPMGFSDTSVDQSYVDNSFGIPSNLPGGQVPLNYTSSPYKYTALEIFGYNENYSLYRGEWDQIQVMTKARALANFGLMDRISLGANAIITGITAATSKIGDDLSNGDFIGAVTDTFNFWGNATAAAVNVIIDTSDLNVFNTWSWYRVNYGGTLYNARELDQGEMSAAITQSVENVLSQGKKTTSPLPKDYTAIKNGPPKPKDTISKCIINGKEYGKGTPAPGVTQKNCTDQKGTWTVDGNGKGETLKQWKQNNDKIFSTASKYGLSCQIDVSGEGDRANKISKFYQCWNTAYGTNSAKVQQDQQKTDDKNKIDNLLGVDSMKEAMKKDPRSNFSAPWSRYICTNSDGTDMGGKDGTKVYLINTDGSLNSACKPVRPPVQDGYFGNGYLPKDGAIPKDTRTSINNKFAIFGGIMDINGQATSFSNFALGITKFFTQVSNFALDLSFTPVMHRLGIDTAITKWIIGLRDGLFFPLIIVSIAFSGLTILVRAAKNQNFGQGFKEALSVVAIFVLSAIMLFSPQKIFTLVDKGPSAVEATIMGTIFNVNKSKSDNLCTASGTSDTTPDTGLNGNPLQFSPQSAVRTMECEVWRAYTFNSYIDGQWGTSYSNLYAHGSAVPQTGGSTLNNTNGNLVGNASVNLGGGQAIENWGLYQVSLLNSGTSTTPDATKTINVLPTNMYRLVDAQAGPNNGAGTDHRFFDTWSGNNPTERMFIASTSTIASGTGMLAIVTYSLTKIELTFISIMLLLFLPIVLITAVHPTFGRNYTKKYFGTLGAVIAQRIFIVLLLSITVCIIGSFGQSGGNVLYANIIITALSLMLFLKRKELLNMIKNSVEGKAGGAFMGGAIPTSLSEAKKKLPRSMQTRMSTNAAARKGYVAGAVGGYIVNGRSGIREGARKGAMASSRSAQRTAGRRGYGTINKFGQAYSAGQKSAEIENKEKNQELMNTTGAKVSQKLNTKRIQEVELEYKSDPNNTAPFDKSRVAKIRFDTNDKNDVKALRTIAIIEEEIEKNEIARKFTLPKGHTRFDKPVKTAQDITQMTPEAKIQYAKQLKEHNEKYYAKAEKLLQDRQAIEEELYQRKQEELEDIPMQLTAEELEKKRIEDQKKELDRIWQTVRGYDQDYSEDPTNKDSEWEN